MPVFVTKDGRQLNDEQASEWFSEVLSVIMRAPIIAVLKRAADPSDPDLEFTMLHVAHKDGTDLNASQRSQVVTLCRRLGMHNMKEAGVA